MSVIVGLLSVGAFTWILYLTRTFDFFYDDWDFVLSAYRWHLRDYFEPHNHHWTLVPQLIYTVLLQTTGMRSYVPFMVVLLLLHVAAAVLLFLLVRRRSGDLLGLIAASMLLFLGRGSEDLIWAFQITFLGSVAFGLFALLVLDTERGGPWRPVAASLSLLVALMCSGIGLLFWVASAADLALDPRRRRYLLALAAPAAVYGGWYLAFERSSAEPNLPLSSAAALVTFVPYGLGSAVAGLFSLSSHWSQLALAALTAATAWAAAEWYRSRRLDSRVVGALSALVIQYLLIGLTRAQVGDGEAAAPRYVYVGAVFLLLGLTGVARDLPWRGLWPAALLILTASVAFNAIHLRQAAADRSPIFPIQRAELDTVWFFRGAPGLDQMAVVDPVLMPQVRARPYVDARRVYGSPRPDTQPVLDGLPAFAVNQAVSNAMPLDVTSNPSGSDATGPCSTLDAGANQVDLVDVGGTSVVVRSRGSGQVGLGLWLEGQSPTAERSVPVTPDRELVVGLPNTGTTVQLHLRVRLPSGVAGSVCPYR